MTQNGCINFSNEKINLFDMYFGYQISNPPSGCPSPVPPSFLACFDFSLKSKEQHMVFYPYNVYFKVFNAKLEIFWLLKRILAEAALPSEW